MIKLVFDYFERDIRFFGIDYMPRQGIGAQIGKLQSYNVLPLVVEAPPLDEALEFIRGK